jgi:hypothetical protein
MERMTMRSWILALVGCLFLLSVPAHMFGVTCKPAFPLEAGKTLGWEGGDAAYTVPLSDGRDVWIFGDTLYGSEREVTGHIPRMTHNSLGISSCDANGKWSIRYAVKRDAAGAATSFFAPKDPKTWYWAMAGFAAKGDLWVTLLCIRQAPKPTPWAMDFETCGADLARVSNLSHDPQEWKVDYFPLVKDGVKAYPSAAALVKDDYAYIFALYEADSRPMVLTRIPLKGLKDPSANLEFLAEDGSWKPGLKPAEAKHVMETGSTEMSVRYDAVRKKWIAVLVDPAGLSDKVYLRTAPLLTGPWTKGDVIYHMPEVVKGTPGNDADTFCYAAKEHPEFETSPDEIMFTYVCNTMNVKKLETELNIYFPQVVTVPMPAAVGSEP